MKKSLLIAVSLLSLSAAHTVAAQEYVTLSAGSWDVADENAPNFGVEYRGTPFWYGLLPIAGVQANTDGGIYGYAGLNYDWEFANNWFLIPTVAVGAYEDGGDSKELGGVVEFRSGIELDYRLANSHRLGLSVHHLSNADIYDHNPGAEQVMLTYSIPVSVFK